MKNEKKLREELRCLKLDMKECGSTRILELRIRQIENALKEFAYMKADYFRDLKKDSKNERDEK